MSTNVFKLLLILLAFISTSVFSFDGNETEMTTKHEDASENPHDDSNFVFYCEKSFELWTFFLKYECEPQLHLNFTTGDHSFVDNNTKRQLARFVEHNYGGYFNLTTLHCEKQPYSYCGDVWQNIWIAYNNDYHNYLLGAVCLTGCLTNIVNFIVLTRKHMINPINIILAVLAVSDFIFLMHGLVFCILFIYRKHFGDERTYDQLWMETLLNLIFYFTFHILSTYLTTLVAGWRYIGIKFPLKSKNFLTKSNAKWATFLILVGVVCYQLTFFMLSQIDYEFFKSEEVETTNSLSEKEPYPDVLPLVMYGDHPELKQMFFALVHKWIPCILLTIFTAGLVRSLMKTNKHWRRITKSGAKTCNSEMSKAADKTNKMLVLILIIFLVTESPSAIGLTTSWFEGFTYECISPLGTIFRLFEYLSCTASFFVYVTMGKMFRTTMLGVRRDISGRFQSKEKDSKTSAILLEPLNATTITSSSYK